MANTISSWKMASPISVVAGRDDDRSTDQLQEENSQLRELLSFQERGIERIIHQMRGLLMVANGYGKLLVEERAGALNSAQKNYLRPMVASTTQMKDLLLTLGGLVEARDLKPSVIDFFDLLDETARTHLPRLILKFNQPVRRLSIYGDREKIAGGLYDALSLLAGPEISVDWTEAQNRLTVTLSSRAAALSEDEAGTARAILRLHGGTLTTSELQTRGKITMELPLVSTFGRWEIR